MSAFKPLLNQGFPLPINHLSPDAFEDFVYQALSVLGMKKGFEMQSGRQPSGDQGFDCTAKTTNNNSLICIQCKRYNSALNIKTVAEEIIKVSLESALNTSVVKQHYIITSGTVATVLRKALRQPDHLDLKNECTRIINGKKFHLALIKNAEDKKLSPADVAAKYIDDLEKLIIWSSTDFNNELLVIWSALDDILERHFTVEKILKDKPTPDFNIETHFNKIFSKNKKSAPLNYTTTSLPSNLQSEKEHDTYKTNVLSESHIMELLKSNKKIVLSSPGGSGKSTTLSAIEQALLTKNDVEHLPIKLKLRSYSRNTLGEMINRELGISYGSWKSLPFKFIFLLDGLDEMLHCDTQAFCDDLFRTIDSFSYIITLRHTGLSVNTIIRSIDTCLTIQPLSYRSAFFIASETFQEEDLRNFYKEYRSKLSSVGFNFFASPFVLSRSIDYYSTHKTLPASTEEILEDWISSKLTQDLSRVTDSDLKLNKLHPSQVTEAFSIVLYKASYDLGLAYISEQSFAELMMVCYDELSDSKSYLTRVVNFYEFTTLIKNYEILYKDDDGFYITPHQIISDYLSSKTLAKNWRNHRNSSFNTAHYDIWLYCSNSIPEEDRQEFLETAFKFDLSLGTKIARKFQGKFVTDIQDKLLNLEQDEKVLTRSNAIYALGLLGTVPCLHRLKSNQGCRDYHQLAQRRRSLALNGNRETLFQILVDNEPLAQGPAQVSGGDYALWFRSPPTVITEIARERVTKWLTDRRPLLRMSLRTLARFGDSTDIENVTAVLDNTDDVGEFFDAAKALLEIDREHAIEAILKISTNDNIKSYWAKKVIIPLGIECDTDREFDYFISLSIIPENEVADQIHQTIDIHSLLSKTNLDEDKIRTLISTYNNLKFSQDFYYRGLLWSLGQSGSPGCLLPLVELAYSRNRPDEIHYAIGYLANSPELDIEESLAQKIDAYFDSLNGKHEGTFRHYVTYYYKHQTKSKDFCFALMRQTTSEKFSMLSPESISLNNYLYTLWEYDIVFEFLEQSTDDESWISEEDALKLLLINTENTGIEKKAVKFNTLKNLDRAKLNSYVTTVEDAATKAYISSYMLFNDLSSNPYALIEEYLPALLSNHLSHLTLVHSCVRHWDDKLARLFLTHFCYLSWDIVSAQLFEQHIDIFLSLLTKKQTEEFERNREAPVNANIERMYRIFLESKGLEIKPMEN
ncbi:restriction endonuclease [Pseudomonas sp. MWU12-2345]|uniref:restriction endonuclease n=1 Tax=Pseudomonas sp. MWU12-2345 TaxID=2928689 RepID=UPI0020106294|nr:restriction endonuclease [Pseudomonas sp. MWU12-2345]